MWEDSSDIEPKCRTVLEAQRALTSDMWRDIREICFQTMVHYLEMQGAKRVQLKLRMRYKSGLTRLYHQLDRAMAVLRLGVRIFPPYRIVSPELDLAHEDLFLEQAEGYVKALEKIDFSALDNKRGF